MQTMQTTSTFKMNVWSFIHKNIRLVLFLLIIGGSGLFYLIQQGYITPSEIMGTGWNIPSATKRATIKGILIDAKTSEPLKIVDKIRLQHDIDNPYTEIDTEGLFTIKDVEIPRNKIIGLVLQLSNGKFLSKDGINLQTDAKLTKGVYSLGIIAIDLSALPAAEDEPLATVPAIIEKKEMYYAKVILKYGHLHMRKYSEATSASTIIKKIPNGTTVKILYSADMPDQINGIDGMWVRAEYQGIEGFVFDGYLRYSGKKPY